MEDHQTVHARNEVKENEISFKYVCLEGYFRFSKVSAYKHVPKACHLEEKAGPSFQQGWTSYSDVRMEIRRENNEVLDRLACVLSNIKNCLNGDAYVTVGIANYIPMVRVLRIIHD